VPGRYRWQCPVRVLLNEGRSGRSEIREGRHSNVRRDPQGFCANCEECVCRYGVSKRFAGSDGVS